MLNPAYIIGARLNSESVGGLPIRIRTGPRVFPFEINMNRALLLLLVLTAAPLCANDIAISAPNARSGWLLLEDPYGEAGQHQSDYVTDPGMPAPDPLVWPHAQTNGKRVQDGSYPQTDLWYYDANTLRYTRATNVLSADRSGSYKRTLFAVFSIGGKPYVLHYDHRQVLKRGYVQVLRVDDATAKAKGAPPETSIVLGSADFIDAPAVSPDGKRVAFRVFGYKDGKLQVSLRVYSVQDWSVIATSEAQTFGRPVWLNNDALAVLAWDAGDLPDAHQRDPALRFSIQILESHTPEPGRLLRLDLKDDAMSATELLAGEFPSDRYTRTLLSDPFGLGLLVARKLDTEVVVELREPKPEGKSRELVRYEAFRGMSRSLGRIRCAGIRVMDRARTFVVSELWRWGGVSVELPFGHSGHALPIGDNSELREYPLPQVSPDGHGGLIDLGRGVAGLLEPVVNPDFEPKVNEGAQLLRHTMLVLGWPGCDTMRNPRVLQRLSKLVRRFTEIGTVRSTLLAFDIKLSANNGTNEKSGRYVELFSSAGRKGKGRIRTEDNLGGNWLVQAIDGDGTITSDDYYSFDGTPPKKAPKMDSKSAGRAGKAYDDLVTQLEARKLLMMSGVDAAPDEGGLYFVRRDYYRDPNSGATWRVWVYRKYGRIINEDAIADTKKEIERIETALKNATGEAKTNLEEDLAKQRQVLNKLDVGRESTEIRFVADLPIGSAGDWAFPHAIAQVQMKFALSNQRSAAVTELTFEPDKWMSLPHLTDLGNGGKRRPDLLLPKVFRIYQRNAAGKLVEQLKATGVDKGFPIPANLVKAAKVVPGYEVPKAAFDFDNSLFVNVPR